MQCLKHARVNRSTQSRAQKEWRNNFLNALISQNTDVQRQVKDSCFFSFPKSVTCAVKWDSGIQIQW